MRAPSCLLSLLLAACGGSVDGVDAGPIPGDAGAADAGATDAGAADAGTPDAGVGLPETCEGACAALGVTVDMAAEQGGFQRAFYGLTAPAASSTGDWALHVEVLSGGVAECPDEQSPSPDYTLVVAGLPLPADAAPLSPTVSFLDFTGRFLDAVPVTRATAATVTPAAARLCPACVGAAAPAHPEGFVAFEIDATFDEGTIAGRVYATHCDSMDVAE